MKISIIFLVVSIIFNISYSVPYISNRLDFVFDGSEQTKTIKLKGQKTHTIFEYRRVAKECIDADGFEYVCYENRPVPIEVIDYNIVGNVDMVFKFLPDDFIPNEKISVQLNDVKIKVRIDGNPNFIAFGKYDKYELVWNRPPTKRFNTTYSVKFEKLSKYLSPISEDITDIKYKDFKVSMVVPKVDYPESYVPRIKIERLEGFFKKILIVDRDVILNRYSLSDTHDNKTLVEIDLNWLRNDLNKKGKYKFTLTSQIKFHGKDMISTNNLKDLAKSESKNLNL